MNDNLAVKAENLRKEYRRADFSVLALDDVDLEVPRGRFLALMGPSGSGKSTLLHLAAGIDKPTRGRIHVLGDDIDRHHPEAAVIDGHHRTVPAAVPAAAATLGKADGARASVGHFEAGIARKRGQTLAAGHDEGHAVEIHFGRLRIYGRRSALGLPRKGDERRFEFAPEHVGDAELVQPGVIHGRIEPIGAKVGEGRQLPNSRQRLDRNAGRGVHGEVKTDQRGTVQSGRFEPLARQIDALDRKARPREQGCGLRQSEWLATDLVGADEHHLHHGPRVHERAVNIAGTAGRPVPSGRRTP